MVMNHLKIVVDESAVLFGVQHLEQCRRRVAPEVLAHLVDLIQEDQRVGGLGLLKRLDDLAGHRPDIGPPVAADLGFVAHAAKADADELTPRGFRHAAPKRGLADARRADEAEDRAFQLGRAGLHGQIFDDAFLDLFQTEVVGIQYLLRGRQILLDAGLHAPRHAQEPVEIVADHGRFGRHRRHGFQLLQLGIRLFARFLGKRGLGDAGLKLGDLVLAVLAIAEFLLNGLHLLVQVVLALGLFHLRLDAGLDLLFHLQDR